MFLRNVVLCDSTFNSDCVQSSPTQKTDFRFSDVDPASAVAYSPNDTQPLRVAVAAVILPKGNVESYSDLLNYLGRKLNRRVELVQRQTYAEVNDLIKNGTVDVGFVCTSAYVIGHNATLAWNCLLRRK